jgi:hypothetical protein
MSTRRMRLNGRFSTFEHRVNLVIIRRHQVARDAAVVGERLHVVLQLRLDDRSRSSSSNTRRRGGRGRV